MRKTAYAALALPLLAAVIPVVLVLGLSSMGVGTPDAGGVPCIPTASPDASPPLHARIAHANLYTGMDASQFADDLATVIADGPDLVTLNETYRRTPAELSPPGYASWRPADPWDARDTTVLWRTDSWQLLEQGNQLMHHRPGVKWGTRYANWASLQHTTGTVVSVISGHASPGGSARDGLIREYVDSLNALITQLAAHGPVLVGADLNIGYRDNPELADWLQASGTVSTFDILGEPDGGWGTGRHPKGPAIDYILINGATPIAHATRTLAQSDHRMLTADIDLVTNCAPDGGPGLGNCPPSGSAAEAGLTPNALLVLRCVNARFGPHAYAGVGDRSDNPSSDHPDGRAVDIMIDQWGTASGVAEGTAIAEWVRTHAAQLGITYIIWRARIWSLGHTDWRPYGHPSGATDPTSAHLDHVHVSTL
jgi:endonuclease/exonuclease/phosphatase (EEP) superfamily protein YafD